MLLPKLVLLLTLWSIYIERITHLAIITVSDYTKTTLIFFTYYSYIASKAWMVAPSLRVMIAFFQFGLLPR